MTIMKTGNPGRDEFTSYLFISLFFILNILFFPTSAFAQSEEEMRILRMYFKEEELVIAPTRAPKSLSQVAENVTVITTKEIEGMNAHTVAEVLERVTGVFVEFLGHDFGSDANLYIQGSKERHVLVLLDGVPWNTLSEGRTVINSIPVRIIKRIEIIKGPASSSWGSSLGGVINIVTKDAGNNGKATGVVSASYGERNTQDYNAEISGKAGTVGYYLYAGRQDSDGLRNNRDFKNDNFYSKLDIPLSSDIKLMFTAAYSEPRINHYGDIPNFYYNSTGIDRTFFITSFLSARFTQELRFEASFYTFKQKFILDEVYNGAPYKKSIFDDETRGGSGKLIWAHDIHTVVLGTDISRGHLDQTNIDYWTEETSRMYPRISKWAVFANDTISIGKLSITPGIRHDHNNVSGDFTSPSLGATYSLAEHTILRASVAKGFTSPPLLFTTSGTSKLDPNPSLKPEKVWSYQAGIESWMADNLKANITIFHHEMEDELIKEKVTGTSKKKYVNKGKTKRDGVEIDVETVSFYNISLKTGFAYVHKKFYLEEDTSEDNYAYNIIVKYDDSKSFSAQLAGNYTWWDLEFTDTAYDTFIWDLNLNKKIYSAEKTSAEIFLTAHNIFNGSHYTYDKRKNPRRWMEAGLRLKF